MCRRLDGVDVVEIGVKVLGEWGVVDNGGLNGNRLFLGIEVD